MYEFLKAFRANETGATSIEYALIGSIVSIAIVGTLHQMAPALTELYETVLAAFTD